MKIYTHYSGELKREITFSLPGKSYIFVDLTGGHHHQGTLGNQICHGGNLLHNRISYSGDDQAVFESICRTWFREYIS